MLGHCQHNVKRITHRQSLWPRWVIFSLFSPITAIQQATWMFIPSFIVTLYANKNPILTIWTRMWEVSNVGNSGVVDSMQQEVWSM